MQFNLDNKCVLITGGSRGIGRACAQLFAHSGALVGITYQSNHHAADKTLSELANDGHTIWQMEMQDAAGIEKCFNAFIRHYGRIDVLINNAGIYTEHKILEVNYQEWQTSWEQTLKVNLQGPANLCYLAAGQMAKQGSGKIINISSRGAFRGEPDHPAYGASKAGLNTMSQSLAVALAPHGVSAYVIAPGFVETDMAAGVLNSEAGQAIKQQSPFGRVAQPEEVARLAAVCASDGFEFSSGAIIDMNGASYLRS